MVILGDISHDRLVIDYIHVLHVNEAGNTKFLLCHAEGQLQVMSIVSFAQRCIVNEVWLVSVNQGTKRQTITPTGNVFRWNHKGEYYLLNRP